MTRIERIYTDGMKGELFRNELTDKIIKAFYNVYNELGFGFLENVYQW
jgi:hypothetical protein